MKIDYKIIIKITITTVLVLFIGLSSKNTYALEENYELTSKEAYALEIKKNILKVRIKILEILIKRKISNFDDMEIKLLAPKNNEIYFAAFPDFGGSEEKVESKIITDFEKLAGKKIAWATFSQNWWQGMEFPQKEINKIRQAGAVPFVRFMPRSDERLNQENQFQKEEKFSLQNIIDGKFDRELKKWAQEARKDGKPILVDFAVEANGFWFLWSGINNGGKTKDKYGDKNYPDGPERWRDAYRHIIDLFKKENTKNITWFFHADLTGSKEEWNLPKYYYPGDQYIDWVGFSFYGPQNNEEKYWDKFSEIWKENHKMISQISHKKPFAVLEIGVSDGNSYGNKALWYDDAFKIILNNPYVKFSAVNFWNENWKNENNSKALIRIDSSYESLESFRKNISNKRFSSKSIFSNLNSSLNFENKKNTVSGEKTLQKWYKPKAEIKWQWQLEGEIKTDLNVDLYDIDLYDSPQKTIDLLHSRNKKVICYFNAGAWEPYRSDSSKFPKEVLGKTMKGWADEKWLDVKNYKKFSSLILARLDLAKEKRCDGIEPDNIDGFQNKTGFNISYNDQLIFNKWLAKEAHKRGLSIALKNDLDQIADLVDDFDFAINEECFQYNECKKLLPFVKNNKAVLGVEYVLAKKDFCAEAESMKFSWIKMRENYLLDGFNDSCR